VTHFWATVVKRFALYYRTVVCLSVLCSCPVLSVTLVYCGQTVGRIKMKPGRQAGLRPRPPTHCARWGPSSPQMGYSPQFSADVRCGQTAGWIKMSLGTEAGLGQGDFVLDGDPAPQKEAQPTNFRPMSIVAKRINSLSCHLIGR